MKIKDYYKEPIVWLVLIILLGFVIGAGKVDDLAIKEGDVGVSDSGKLIRAISVILVGGISFIYFVSRNAVKYLLYGTNRFLLVFMLLCVLSTIFSPIPFITLFKSTELIAMLLLLSVAYASKDLYTTSKRFIIALLVFYTLTTLGVYLQFAIYGSEGQRQLVGVTPLFGFMLTSKYPGMVGNALGYLGAIVALFGIYLTATLKSKNNNRLIIGSVVFLLGAGVTFFSYTRSVMFFLYVATFLYFIYKRKYLINALMVLLVILPLFMPQVQDKIIDHLRRGASEDQIESMSGRTEMWHEVFDRRIIKIIIGGGYATGAKFLNYEKTGKLLVQSNVHNGFLEVVTSIGILGGIVWIAIMVRISMQFYFFYRKSRFRLSLAERNFHIFMMALLFLSLSRSMMNSTFVYLDYFYPVLMAFALYGDSLKNKAKQIMKTDSKFTSKDTPNPAPPHLIDQGIFNKRSRHVIHKKNVK